MHQEVPTWGCEGRGQLNLRNAGKENKKKREGKGKVEGV